MKKLLPLISVIFLLTGCYDDSALLERIDALEQGSTNLTEQTAALQQSIESLKSVDAEVKTAITELQTKEGNHAEAIQQLQEFDKQLQKGIADLTTQAEKELSNAKTWANETFVTIEVYNGLLTELEKVQKQIGSQLQGLDKKITDSADAIKAWVNETLKAYYTSAQVDAKLQELKDQLTAMETKLNNLLRVFRITFDNIEVIAVPGSVTTVNYTIEGATQTTIVKAVGQSGWSAKVKQLTNETGEITVTAPDPMADDEIIVIVYDGEYRTIVSSINFVTGVATPSMKTIQAPAEGGQYNVTISTNLNYTVSIPEAEKTWISILPQVKALREDQLSFTIAANDGLDRQSKISLVTADGDVADEIIVMQDGYTIGVTGTGITADGDNKFKMDVSKAGGSFNVTVNTDAPKWYIRKVDQTDRYTVTPTEGVSGGTATITVDREYDMQANSCTFLITTSKDATEGITLTLNQEASDILLAKKVTKLAITGLTDNMNVNYDFPIMYRPENKDIPYIWGSPVHLNGIYRNVERDWHTLYLNYEATVESPNGNIDVKLRKHGTHEPFVYPKYVLEFLNDTHTKFRYKIPYDYAYYDVVIYARGTDIELFRIYFNYDSYDAA